MDIGAGGKPQEQHGKMWQLDRGLAALTVLIFSLIGCISYGRQYSSVAPGIPASPPKLTIQSVSNRMALERVAAVWQLKSKTVTQVPPLAVRWPAPIFWSYDQPLTITWHSPDPPSFIILLMYSRSGLSKQGIPTTRHLFMCVPNESQRQSGDAVWVRLRWSFICQKTYTPRCLQSSAQAGTRVSRVTINAL